MNQTVYVIVGLGLAGLAVIITFVGMRWKSFPNRPAYVAIFLLFIALAAGTATFAVRFSVDEQNHRDQNEKKSVEGADNADAQPLAPVVSKHTF